MTVKRCSHCGGVMTEGQKSRQELLERQEREMMNEIDSTYAHLRAVIENAKTMDAAAIRHQLVGLLPETRGMDPEQETELREKGMGNLVDRHEQRVREGWAKYGYGESA